MKIYLSFTHSTSPSTFVRPTILSALVEDEDPSRFASPELVSQPPEVLRESSLRRPGHRTALRKRPSATRPLGLGFASLQMRQNPLFEPLYSESSRRRKRVLLAVFALWRWTKNNAVSTETGQINPTILSQGVGFLVLRPISRTLSNQ
ncbi:hypothetical protein [Lysobacter firmicutimachus]|uniref:Uncharacterized protein n=2 Tax=Lysobacter TaxID=68 RepID=A0ABU8CXF6_9GAMM